MKKAKLIAIVGVSILALVIVLQNTEVTRTHILFWSMQMSQALLLILTLVLGFVIGVLVAGYSLRRKRSKA
ncbi:MAG: DUF1049 domain-containing protein [Sedimentisphaerales bacterium]|nr:DUF1049 domain-containing protein [Sedimentisphaerales bacterium]